MSKDSRLQFTSRLVLTKVIGQAGVKVNCSEFHFWPFTEEQLVKDIGRQHMFTMPIPTISFALLICLIEIPNIVGAGERNPQINDSAVSHNWLVTRDMWLAREHNNTEKIDVPLPLVVIQHTVSAQCNSFFQCAAQLRSLQSYFLNTFNNDIPYNFIIGNDGKVYEGRGWNKVGGHTLGYNHCSLSLGFVGDYRENVKGSAKVTALQEARAQMLFLEGIRLGHLRPNFHVLGAMDLMYTLSPVEKRLSIAVYQG
ncbi:unnamed protein product [Arctia plantaginis]|uniref:Peptidoglycan-recognition protein n=1 Tax=Arctia plantaginis TaxID=874455 RepID=A0A8S1AIL3_ARCPL|nr:unnamed protein product [Arctia plantaginis]